MRHACKKCSTQVHHLTILWNEVAKKPSKEKMTWWRRWDEIRQKQCSTFRMTSKNPKQIIISSIFIKSFSVFKMLKITHSSKNSPVIATQDTLHRRNLTIAKMHLQSNKL